MAQGERYPLEAEIFFRDSTEEWVLELKGAIRDTSVMCRHAQPASVSPEDVPGLPTFYPDPGDFGDYPSHWPQDAVAHAKRLRAALEPFAALSPDPEADIPDDHLCLVPAGALRLADHVFCAAAGVSYEPVAEALDAAIDYVLGPCVAEAMRADGKERFDLHQAACLKAFTDDLTGPAVDSLKAMMHHFKEHGEYPSMADMPAP